MSSFPAVTVRQIGANTAQAVIARELHAALGNGDHFATWIRDRIKQFDFTQDVDFVIYSEKGEKGAPRVEYALSLDMAKELAMVERTAKGKQVRQYFIDCERRAKGAAPSLPNFSNPAIAARAWAEQYERGELAEARVAVLTPKASKYDAFISSDGLFGFDNAGRALGCRPRLFTKWLREKYCFHQGGALIPRAKYAQAGYFIVRPEVGTDDVSRPRGWVTPKGMDFLTDLIPPEIMIQPPVGQTKLLPLNSAEQRP